MEFVGSFATLPRKKKEKMSREELESEDTKRKLASLNIVYSAPVPPPRTKHKQRKSIGATLPRKLPSEQDKDMMDKLKHHRSLSVKHKKESSPELIEAMERCKLNEEVKQCDVVESSKTVRELREPDILLSSKRVGSFRGMIRNLRSGKLFNHNHETKSSDTSQSKHRSNKHKTTPNERQLDKNRNEKDEYIRKYDRNTSDSFKEKALAENTVTLQDQANILLTTDAHKMHTTTPVRPVIGRPPTSNRRTSRCPSVISPGLLPMRVSRIDASPSDSSTPNFISTPVKPLLSADKLGETLKHYRSNGNSSVCDRLAETCSSQDYNSMMQYYNISPDVAENNSPRSISPSPLRGRNKYRSPYSSTSSLNISGEDLEVVMKRKKKIKIRPPSISSDDKKKKRISLEINLLPVDNPNNNSDITDEDKHTEQNRPLVERINIADLTSTETAMHLKKQFNKLKVRTNSLKVKDTELKQRFLILQSKRGRLNSTEREREPSCTRVSGGGITKHRSRTSLTML